MASNFTDAEELYFSFNTAVNVSLFCTIIVPALTLHLLCVLALRFADAINWPVRVLLINTFMPDICMWIGLTVLLLGYPVRASIPGEGDFSCNSFVGFIFVGVAQKYFSIALYAIAVYVFLKYGVQKLKWYYITQYLVLSWIVSVVIGLLPYFDAFGVSEHYGFCEISEKTPLFKGYITMIMVGAFVLKSIIIVFTGLTYCLIRRTKIRENVPVNKDIARYLLYLNIVVILTLIYSIVPASFASIRAGFEGEEFLLGYTLVKFIRMFMLFPSVITPIAALIILKPVRSALKRGVKKWICRKHEELDTAVILQNVSTDSY